MKKAIQFLTSIVFIIALGVAAILLVVAEKESEGSEWSYEGDHGPAHWGGLKPDYALCKTGKGQSPIDITNTVKADLPPIQFGYQPATLRIINNGHTIQVNYPEGSFVTVGGRQFQLVQFHFHHPSEEKIRGKDFAMVVHLVHRNAEGNLAVVAVLMDKGRDNAFIKTLWERLPREVDKEEVSTSVMIDPSGLLPPQRGYYAYSGSLTTPPCTEGVTWFVLKAPVNLSEAQIKRFSTLYTHNARPVQPLHGRVVSETR